MLCPALQPPVGPPGHPSFPSGHALQSRLVANWLKEITPKDKNGVSFYAKQLDWITDRITTNRERVGVHYPSDGTAGHAIADVVYNEMKAMMTPIIPKLVSDAGSEW